MHVEGGIWGGGAEVCKRDAGGEVEDLDGEYVERDRADGETEQGQWCEVKEPGGEGGD